MKFSRPRAWGGGQLVTRCPDRPALAPSRSTLPQPGSLSLPEEGGGRRRRGGGRRKWGQGEGGGRAEEECGRYYGPTPIPTPADLPSSMLGNSSGKGPVTVPQGFQETYSQTTPCVLNAVHSYAESGRDCPKQVLVLWLSSSTKRPRSKTTTISLITIFHKRPHLQIM